MDLRLYQQRSVADIRSAFASGRRAPLLVSPTGSGKTVMFSHIAHGAAAKGNRIQVIAHRQEIIRQICSSLNEFDVPHGTIVSNRQPAGHHLTQVASVQTLGRRLDQVMAPDLVIIDEAHHSASATYRKIIAAYPRARFLGVTATPERLDGRGLGDIFDTIILGPSVQYLIDESYLSRPVYYAPPGSVDTSQLPIVAGDFDKHSSEILMDTPKIVGDAVSHYTRICAGRPAVAFCVSLKHAEHVRDQFRAVGYRAEMIDGKLDDVTRLDRVRALADGRIHVLVSVDLISEGFDLPAVAAAILLRPTASLALHLQQIGRALRIFPGKQCAYIIDHVGNILRHGLAEETREWKLDAVRRTRARSQDSEFKNRQCKKCYAVHAPAPVCPLCGYVYEIESREVDQVEGTLTEITADELAKRRAQAEVGQATGREELVVIAQRRGYKPQWVDTIMDIRARKEKERRAIESRQGMLL